MFNNRLSETEIRRAQVQHALDAKKAHADRNRMGQFATPGPLAHDILQYAKTQLGTVDRIRFLDPAFGTGAFYSALLSVFSRSRIQAAVGYEIDRHYGVPARDLWSDTGLRLHLEDFTQAEAPAEPEKADLLICNPPYVRHHHICKDEKQRLQHRTRAVSGMRLSGLAGLYCHFLGLSHAWMRDNALAGWLIPGEFMDVNYGAALRRYLLDKVTLLHIHRFNPTERQFSDALVSASVVWFRKAPAPAGHRVRFSYGGTLMHPEADRTVPVEALRHTSKWSGFPTKTENKTAHSTVLGDFFHIKRGLVTGNNRFFILSADDIAQHQLPKAAFRPVLPSPRYLPDNEIRADEAGIPLLDRRLFLLDPPWSEAVIRETCPALWRYLEHGKAQGIANGYLCRRRKPWYKQERRPPSPFLCTYLGRSNTRDAQPFRFILNTSQATATNVYLMLYPKPPVKAFLKEHPEVLRRIWMLLNTLRPEDLIAEGRSYGGGLYKLEPRELANAPAGTLWSLLSEHGLPLT